MKISYIVTLKEYLWYQWLFSRYSSARAPLAIRLWLTLVLLFNLYVFATDYYRDYGWRIPHTSDLEHRPLIFIVAILVVSIPLLIAVATPIAWWLKRRQLLEIDRETVAFHHGRHKLRLIWRAITSVDQDDEYIYIGSKYVGAKWPTPGAVLFAMVPKRAFPTPIEAQRFFDQARAYYLEAANGPVAPAGAGVWPPAPRVGKIVQ